MIFFQHLWLILKIDTNNNPSDVNNSSDINEDQYIRRVGGYDSKKICLEFST